MRRDPRATRKTLITGGALLVLTLVLAVGFTAGYREYARYQKRADAHNDARVARIELIKYDALVEQEQKKAEVRVAEAHGIAESQRIIDSSLTGSYLQYLAIQAQMEMANSPNHTVQYIPVGELGIPLVQDVGRHNE